MTKYLLDKPGGPWDFPALGFSAINGAILNGALSSPAITSTPGPEWSVYVGGSAETGITRYAPPATSPTYTEPQDGYVLRYSDPANAYVPQSMEDVLSDTLGPTLEDILPEALESVRGIPGGVAGLDGDARLDETNVPVRLTEPELDANYVSEGSAFADIAKYPGVDPTGTVECAAAINSALSDVLSSGKRAYARGTFNVASTVIIEGGADLSDATFNWTGPNTGIAVQIGAGTSGTRCNRKRIALPQILNLGKSGAGWAGSSVGVLAVNTYGCQIIAPRIRGFVTGYYAYGLGTGNVMNDVYVLHLENNKRNLVSGAGGGGWSNSNNFRLGSLSHESSEGSSVAGARQILIESAANLVNGNKYIGGSVEGNTAEYHVECNGIHNEWSSVRWENSSGCRVLWGASAVRNVIAYGYTAHTIIETHAPGSSRNHVLTTGTSRVPGGTSTTPVLWLENVSSGSAFADVVMDPGANTSGAAAATAYRVARSASMTRMKRAADAHDRLQLDHENGRVYFGDGTAAPTAYLFVLNGALVFRGGSGTVTTIAPT